MATDYWLEEIYIEKTRHLEDVTLSFPSNITCISGENGTGKSTILALIACKHSKKSPGYRDNEYFFFEDGEYYTMSTFMKKTIHDTFSDEWKVNYTVLTHSEDGRERADGTKVYERSSRYQTNYGWRFENKHRFKRPLFYWRWKDNIPSLENPSIAKRLSDFDLAANQTYIEGLQTSLRYVFDDHTIDIEPLSRTNDNPFTTVFKWTDHSTYNSASGKDKTIRLLALLYRIQNKSIVLIDEFEIGLHPKIQVSLLKEMRSIAERKRLQIILTTHSRDIIAVTKPEERIHLSNINGSIEIYSQPSEQFIFSDISDEKLEIFCEDEVAQLWLEEIIKFNGQRSLLNNITFLPIGSCSEVINHSKATFRNSGFFISVLDGDKKAENELERTIRPAKFYQKINEEDRETLRSMYEMNTQYLPSELAPEKLFLEILNTSQLYKDKFKDEYNIQDGTISYIVEQLSELDNHHKYYETAAKILNEPEDRVIRWSINALLKTDEDIKDHCKEHIVDKILSILEASGHNGEN